MALLGRERDEGCRVGVRHPRSAFLLQHAYHCEQHRACPDPLTNRIGTLAVQIFGERGPQDDDLCERAIITLGNEGAVDHFQALDREVCVGDTYQLGVSVLALHY